MWRKILGWALFAYGVGGVIYSLVTMPLIALPVQLALGVLFIGGGWFLAHPKVKPPIRGKK
ncbi:hypothetical protein ES703_40068 [subsurface metagenome]